MDVGKRLKELREEMGMSQAEIAKKMGVARTTYLKWENGENKPSRKLNQLSQLFNVSVDYLLCRSDIRKINLKDNFTNQIKIPLLNEIGGNKNWQDLAKNTQAYEEITPELAATGDFFALKVSEDTMSPKLERGDIVIVKKQHEIDSDDVAVVQIKHKAATIQKIKKVSGGIILYGYNTSTCSPHFYSRQQIKTDPIIILGKVVESRRYW